MLYIEKDVDEVIATVKSDDDKVLLLRYEDKKCTSMIVRRIADSHLEYVKDKRNSFQIMSALRATFERKSIASQLYLRKKLLLMKCGEGENLMHHFLEFDKVVRDLKSSGAKMEDLDIVCSLLLTLSESFSVVVSTLETLDPSQLNMEFVRGHLLDEANKRKSVVQISNYYDEDVAMHGAAFRWKCYFCHQVGHR